MLQELRFDVSGIFPGRNLVSKEVAYIAQDETREVDSAPVMALPKTITLSGTGYLTELRQNCSFLGHTKPG